VTLGAAQTNVATSLVLAAGESAKVMVTDLIEVEDEIQWVTAINAATETLTVVRGMGGTTAVAHTLLDADSNARVLQLMSPAAQENADTPLGVITKGGVEFNLPQLIDLAVQVSDRENVTPDYEYNSGSKYNGYLKKTMKEAAIKHEILFIRGRRGSESSAVVGSGTPTTMGGLRFFTDQNYDLSGAPLDEATFLDAVQRSWERVGSENTPDTILVGPFGKRIISSLWNSNRYSTVKDKSTTLVWDSVETDFGRLKFQMSRYIPAGELYLIDVSDISKHAYQNGAWHEAMLPANGPYKKGAFRGDYTSVWLGNQKRQRLSNFSTDRANYPNM
jgi:hypothetical protein